MHNALRNIRAPDSALAACVQHAGSIPRARTNIQYAPLTWFDVEMREALGIDIYHYPFPREKGYTTIQAGNIELLIFKAELAQQIKEQVCADFLGLANFQLVKRNAARTTPYSTTYTRFIQNAPLPSSYVETMCQSKYMQHFYTDEEMQQVRDRWTRSTAT